METANFRFSDGYKAAVEFDAVIVSPEQWAVDAIDALIEFRVKTQKRWHKGDTREWVRYYPTAQLHSHIDYNWFSTQDCTHFTTFCAEAREIKTLVKPVAEKRAMAEADNYFMDERWCISIAAQVLSNWSDNRRYADQINVLIGHGVKHAFGEN